MPNKRTVIVGSRKYLYNKYGGKCAYCGKPLHKFGWHRDHIQPLLRYRNTRYSFNGRNGCVNPENHNNGNLVAACAGCNLDKGTLDLETWRASLNWTGFLTPIVFWFEKYEAEHAVTESSSSR